jgi:hypothetical protein
MGSSLEYAYGGHLISRQKPPYRSHISMQADQVNSNLLKHEQGSVTGQAVWSFREKVMNILSA